MTESEKRIINEIIELLEKRMPSQGGQRGVLVAEGDSWFDSPSLRDLWGSDIPEELEDLDYQVESVADSSDTLEEMAYSRKQFRKLARRLKWLARAGETPRAILLSGGGNDCTGAVLEGLLNHSQSGLPTLNEDMVKCLIDVHLCEAYKHLIRLITGLCDELFKPSKPIPVLVHGYAYAVPDGRGIFRLPSFWLKPAFEKKGYTDLKKNTETIKKLIDRFNDMIASLCKVKGFGHVRHVDVRDCLTNDLENDQYQNDWIDELHPTDGGFKRIAEKFKEIIEGSNE